MTISLAIGLGITHTQNIVSGGGGPPTNSVPPSIAITSGGGYAGSTYTATPGTWSSGSPTGQWRAGGVDISGETASTYVMTTANEGAAITYRETNTAVTADSNSIEMWTFQDITTKTNGGWWDPKIAVTSASTLISSVADQFSVRDMTQSTDAQKPVLTTISGYDGMVWPSTDNNVYLGPVSAFAPAYWLMVMAYKDSVTSTFTGYDSVFSNGVENNSRVMGSQGTDHLHSTTPFVAITKNAGTRSTSVSTSILPMAKSIIEIETLGASYAYAIGRSNASLATRGWRGPIFEVLALGTVPTGTELAKIQGCAAWRNGLEASLPPGHTYASAGPTI